MLPPYTTGGIDTDDPKRAGRCSQRRWCAFSVRPGSSSRRPARYTRWLDVASAAATRR